MERGSQVLSTAIDGTYYTRSTREPEKNQTDSGRIHFGYNVTGDLFFPTILPGTRNCPR